MFWTIIVLLLIFWLLGFLFHFAGALIHILLLIALAFLVVNLLNARKTRA